MSSYSNLYKYVECCDGCGATGATCASQQALITSLTTRTSTLEALITSLTTRTSTLEAFITSQQALITSLTNRILALETTKIIKH